MKLLHTLRIPRNLVKTMDIIGTDNYGFRLNFLEPIEIVLDDFTMITQGQLAETTNEKIYGGHPSPNRGRKSKGRRRRNPDLLQGKNSRK